MYNRGLLSGLMGWVLSVALWAPLAIADDDTVHYRLAVVQMAVVLNRSPQSGAASQNLRNLYAAREEALAIEQDEVRKAEDAFRRESMSLSQAESIKRESQLRIRQRQLKRTREDLREEVRVAKDKALTELQKDVAEAIDAIRERESIDIVFRESDYIVASSRVDITGQVLEYLQQQFEAGQNQLPNIVGSTSTEADQLERIESPGTPVDSPSNNTGKAIGEGSSE